MILLLNFYVYLQVKQRFKPLIRDSLGCDLLDKMLVLDPEKRIDAHNALDHEFFWTDPMPSVNLSKMLRQMKTNNFEYFYRAPKPREESKMFSNNSNQTTSSTGFPGRIF